MLPTELPPPPARIATPNRWATSLAGLAILLVLILASSPAYAGFTVCNQTLDVVNLAIGRQVNDVFTTRGWWTVGTNQCAHVIKEDLDTRYVYIYAEDVFGQPLLSGTTGLCIEASRFETTNTDECWQNREKAAKFLEVDTKSEPNWTLFLEERAD